MSLYNVEIFTQNMEYKSSYQVQNKGKYEYDYLSISVNKIDIPQIAASKGDYISITSNDISIFGIITGCTDKGMYYQVEYKHFLDVTDIKVYFDRTRLSSITLEQWIAEIINATYVSNVDNEQNIYGLYVTYEAHTNNALLDLESNIGNLYEILQKALINYNVTVNFSLDIAQKKIHAHVSAQTQKLFYIEADLPNILEKDFNFKKSDSSFNKMYVYNEVNESEMLIFYLDTDGVISTAPADEKRITPVVFTTIFVKREDDDDETFYEKAYEKAFNKLTAVKYDNLIEIEVNQDDELLNPLDLEVGQPTAIIHNSIVYNTILTGYEIDDTVKLMFGTVRIELTKKLKRRL